MGSWVRKVRWEAAYRPEPDRGRPAPGGRRTSKLAWLAKVLVLNELHRILAAMLKLPAARIAEIEAFLRNSEVIIRYRQVFDLEVRDQTDTLALASAVVVPAVELGTGDQHLLVLGGRAPLPILGPRGFRDTAWAQVLEGYQEHSCAKSSLRALLESLAVANDTSSSVVNSASGPAEVASGRASEKE